MYEKLAVLRSLAIRPSREIAPCLQPMIDELLKAGYIINDKESGWMATVEGCEFIERNRAVSSIPAPR
jgi:hypothetical protein